MREKNNFNIMRLLLSIMVVYSHSYGLLALPEPTILNRSMGNFAVHCFFVLSGYLITLSCLRSKNMFDFLYKRFLRITPAFVVAYFFAHFLAAKCNSFNALPVPYISNGPIWTLSWEVMAYIFCGIIGFVGLLTPTALGSFWLISWVAIIVNVCNQSPTNKVIVPMLFLFLSGGFLAVNEEKFKLHVSGLISIGILIIIGIKPGAIEGVIKLFPWLYGPNFSSGLINYFLYLLLLPSSIIYLGKYVSFKIETKVDISYGIYIYAWPIQQTIVFLFIKYNVLLKPILLFIISSIFAAIISYISWRFIEKPAIDLKKIDAYSSFLNCVKKIHGQFKA